MSEIVNPLKWWYAEHDTTLSGHQIIAREDEAPYAYTCAGNAQEICDAGNALAELTKERDGLKAQIGDAENWLSLPEPSFETIGERVKLLYDQLNYSKETIKFQSERIRDLQRSNQAIESALHSKEEHTAWRRYFMAACEIYADEQAKRAALEQQVAVLRKEWWFNHGCGDGTAHLYGDDGEMQCNKCFTDFKRTPFKELKQRVDGLRLAALRRQDEPAA